MKKKAYLNTITSLVMQITSVICGFIVPRLMLERYGSEVNGLIQSITQFLGLITFMELGVGQVIQSALYKPLANGDREQISCILKSGANYFQKIAYGLLAYIAILLVLFPAITDDRFHWGDIAALICAISAGTLAQYYFGLVDKILLSADQRGYIQYSAQIVTTLLNTAAVMLMVHAGCSVQLVKAGTAVIFLLNPLAVRWYIRRNYEIDRKIKYKEEPVSQKWNGIAQHISAVVLEGTDNIVLTLFATLSDVSIYSTYFLVISGVRQLYVSLTAGLQSMVGSLWARNEIGRLERLFQRIETALHLFVVFVFSCVAVLIVPFIRVYTNGLTDAEYVQPAFAAILTLAYGIRCLRTPYNMMILAGGHYKQTQKCHIAAAVLNIVISVFAVRRWGLIGIALGTLAAFTYQTLWMVWYNSRALLRLPLRRTMKRFLADAAAATAIVLVLQGLELRTVSYWGWFCMAVPAAVIALVITGIMGVLTNRHEILRLWSCGRR